VLEPAATLRRSLALNRDTIVAPLAAALVLGVLENGGQHLRTGLLALVAMAAGAALARRVSPQAALLPIMRAVFPLIGPLIGVSVLAGLELLTGTPAAGPLDLLATFGVGALVSGAGPALLGGGGRARRVAYVGSAAAAARLHRALTHGGSRGYALVGRVPGHVEPEPAGPEEVPVLGGLHSLDALAVEHGIDDLVVGAEAPKRAVYERVTQSCLHLPIRFVELTALYEEAFGHVPMAEIDVDWFQCLADPRGRSAIGPIKRAIDVVVAAAAGVLALPVIGALALLIRRDGGPVLFRQIRIGRGGRPFCLYKLRTMRPGTGTAAQWAEIDDPRITSIGRFLRGTHLDELPQLFNVLRGEMTLVGPRPEQPAFVDRLERTLPHYQRRHLITPGITGWAQIRCGYAGSDSGSAWKLCHDLYYIKHRSIGFDLLILCETLATLVFEREDILRPESVAYVLGDRA
jgi:exopolysaccharide biosynthesis polyprenyl glycosylphosphotransferase